jgi:hypothetical protein
LKSSDYYRKLALHEWDVAAAAVIVIIALIAWKLLTPLGGEVYSSTKTVLSNMTMLAKADSIAALPELTRRQADKIDSCIKAISSIQMISEQAVPGTIYTLANQAGIKASKVEISGKTTAGQGSQIPVTFRGAGDYTACGKFIEGVENLQPAGRILEVNMKNTGNGIVDLFVDFILVSQK